MRKIIRTLIAALLLGLTGTSVVLADSASDQVFIAAKKLASDSSRSVTHKINILMHLLDRVDRSQLELLHKDSTGEKAQQHPFDRKAVTRAIAKQLLM